MDNVLEHTISTMKVTKGLVGITQNASTLGLLITAPELGRLTEKAHKMAGSPAATRKEHDDLSMVVCMTRQKKTLL